VLHIGKWNKKKSNDFLEQDQEKHDMT